MRDATPTNHVLSVESEGGERVRLEGQLVEEEEEGDDEEGKGEEGKGVIAEETEGSGLVASSEC